MPTADPTQWTSYHDWLQQEAIALMTEPDWVSKPDITARLATIRETLSAASDSLGKTADGKTSQEKLQSVLGQMETAQNEAKSMNESRYAELTGYNKATGAYDGNTGYNKLASDYSTLYQGAGGAKSIYDSMLGTTQTANTAISSKIAAERAAANAKVAGLGNAQRTELADRYASERASSQQQLMRRGLGNSTVLGSVNTGLQRAESKDRAALEEGLTREQMSYDQAWANSGLSAQQQALQSENAIRSQQGTLAQQYAAMLNQIGAAKLGTIENRTDAAPSLSDIANLSSQLGKGASSQSILPSQTATMTFGAGSASNPFGSGSQNSLFG